MCDVLKRWGFVLSYVVSYKSLTPTSAVKFWIWALPEEKLFSTPPIPCCAVPSIREWQAQSLEVKHQTDNCTMKIHPLKCLFLPLTGSESHAKCLTVLWKGSQKEMNVINKTIFFVCLFFFHQKQPPNCPPVSMPQRWQPVAYKLLHSCERKHSSICQRKGENGRIIVMINQQVLTSTLTNIAPSGKVDSNGWIHGSLSDRLKGDFLLFFHCLLVHRFAKLNSQAQWLLSLTAWFNMLNLP